PNGSQELRNHSGRGPCRRRQRQQHPSGSKRRAGRKASPHHQAEPQIHRGHAGHRQGGSAVGGSWNSEYLAGGVPQVKHKQTDRDIGAQEHEDPSGRRFEPIQAGLSSHRHVSSAGPAKLSPLRQSSLTASAAFGPRKTSSISLVLPSSSSARIPGRSTTGRAGEPK